MIKHISNILASAILVFAIVLTWHTRAENEFLRSSLRAYGIANGKNAGKARIAENAQLFNNIEYLTGTPGSMLRAIQVHENIGDVFSFGVKKIPVEIMCSYHPREWQARAAARICAQEAFDYITSSPEHEKAFFQELGKRYCGWDANWGDSTYKIYKQQEKK